MKAVLAYRGITYRRVHSITYLLGLLEDHEFPGAAAGRGARDAPRRGLPQARYDHDTEGASSTARLPSNWSPRSHVGAGRADRLNVSL